MRAYGREKDALRPVALQGGFLRQTPGSVLVEWGGTRVLCTAMLEERVPPFKAGMGEGWLTAEYAMLPASTPIRKPRAGFKPDGRATEIQRLIGRSLRTAVDFSALGERTLWVDCDVLEADGGTRTAAITGAWTALALAQRHWLKAGVLAKPFLAGQVAAVSVGVLPDGPLLDLEYTEDSAALVDMNVVMTGDGRFIEIQGTGEQRPFDPKELEELLALAKKGIGELLALQRQAVEEAHDADPCIQ